MFIHEHMQGCNFFIINGNYTHKLAYTATQVKHGPLLFILFYWCSCHFDCLLASLIISTLFLKLAIKNCVQISALEQSSYP
jgi:hypothetical protein